MESFEQMQTKQGFTLIELSIVLVIIGLIIGGVFAGQSMIYNAKINSVISEADKYKTALLTFKMKYSKYPGDLPNASSYWPDCDPTPSKCNGNGNDRIEMINAWAPPKMESLRAWQQLGAAGMINGTYTGSGGRGYPNYQYAEVGVNLPPSEVETGAFALGYSSQYMHKKRNINYLQFGSLYGTFYSIDNGGGILNPRESFAIDNKIDDGSADSGNFMAFNKRDGGGTSTSPFVADSCVRGYASQPNAPYNFDTEARNCSLSFVIYN